MKQVPLKDIKPNPNNPRVIKDDKFAKLVQSLKDLPEMASVRPIVVNQDMIVLGGGCSGRSCDGGNEESRRIGWTISATECCSAADDVRLSRNSKSVGSRSRAVRKQWQVRFTTPPPATGAFFGRVRE